MIIIIINVDKTVDTKSVSKVPFTVQTSGKGNYGLTDSASKNIQVCPGLYILVKGMEYQLPYQSLAYGGASALKGVGPQWMPLTHTTWILSSNKQCLSPNSIWVLVYQGFWDIL